jgi:antitoxin ParD1/3/4
LHRSFDIERVGDEVVASAAHFKGGGTPASIRKSATGAGRKSCHQPSVVVPATMANVEKLSVALTPDMVAEVRAAVEGGDYGSVSEVVRDALRDWRLRRKIETLETEELRRLVREGMASGAGLDADTVFARLRARFRQQSSE